MKWFRFARWCPIDEEMMYSEPLAHGYMERKHYTKWIDLNHEGRTKWHLDKKCVISPTGETSCKRTGPIW